MNRYETSGVISDELYKQMRQAVLYGGMSTHKFGGRIMGSYICLIFLVIISVIKKSLPGMLMCTILLIYVLRVHFSVWRNIRKVYQEECSTSSSVKPEYTTSFTMEGIEILNNDNGRKTEDRYSNFLCMTETKDYIFILLRNSRYAMIFKSRLNEDQCQELKQWIRKMCPGIRMTKFIKKKLITKYD